MDLSIVKHHPAIEELADVLCKKTQNTDKAFFRIVVSYFLAKMASSMRAVIQTKDRGPIPVNAYTIALATSGYGKGYSVNILEEQFMKAFRKRFIGETMPLKAEEHIQVVAMDRSIRNNTDFQAEYDAAQSEYRRKGAYRFTFDDGTAPALKQMREKLLLGNIGSINFQVDEIGTNLERSGDILGSFLELYDQGLIKNKLTKNTSENIRDEEVEGKTPANMLLFGTPSKLLDGSKIEETFYSLLDTGYARRCLFAFGTQERRALHSQTPAEIWANLTSPKNDQTIDRWAKWFHNLADPARFGWTMTVSDQVGIAYITYKVTCEKEAEKFKDFQFIQKAEMEHRFSKALKLAGILAFIDGSTEVEMDHLLQAIKVVEESAHAFNRLLSREQVHVRLGKYIADIGTEVTHHDLLEALPFYPRSAAGQNTMLNHAMAWGYKNNVIIRKTFTDGIEFYRGETLQKTDLNKIRIAYSDNWAYEYQMDEIPFYDEETHEDLSFLTQSAGLHWCNHAFKNGHRLEENVIPGFNLLVLDVDGGISIDMAHELLKDYKILTYTTKRHTDEAPRFRLLIPTNYVLYLDKNEYKELVNDVMSWLPFQANVDESSNQRSKKWLSHEGEYRYNFEGELFDILPFIPKTKKNEEYRAANKSVQSLDNLERWFVNNIGREGSGRNNQLIKYALALMDNNFAYEEIAQKVLELNSRLEEPLEENEINSTILKSVAQKMQKLA